MTVGATAPDFALKTKNAEGIKEVKLKDNLGKRSTVLLFFPAAFTGVCTQEMCDVSNGLKAYSDMNAAVYGISVDTPFAQEAWAKQEKITIPLLSDLNKTVTRAYDVLFPNLAEIGDTSARAAIVIDKGGKIVYYEKTATPKDLPNFEKVKEAVKKASGESCGTGCGCH